MSKAENKVQWCLNQAKKQLAEGKKHRGLVIVKSDDALAREYVAKAEHNLEVFLLNKKHGYYDWAIDIGFYVTYHCCLAIITKFGYESRNQDCTLAVVESLIEEGKISQDFKRYVDAISADMGDDKVIPMREKYQYTPSQSQIAHRRSQTGGTIPPCGMCNRLLPICMLASLGAICSDH